MNDQVILVVGTSKFLMTSDEAFAIATTLNERFQVPKGQVVNVKE